MERPNLDYASPNAPRRAKPPWIVILLAVLIAGALLMFVLFRMMGA